MGAVEKRERISGELKGSSCLRDRGGHLQDDHAFFMRTAWIPAPGFAEGRIKPLGDHDPDRITRRGSLRASPKDERQMELPEYPIHRPLTTCSNPE